MLKIIVVEWW